MTVAIRKLFWVSRPLLWLDTAFPFAAAYLVSGGHIDFTLIVGTLYFLWPYNLFLYGINDVYDYESDLLNPRKGGIEGMREKRDFHPKIIKATVLFNAPFVLYLLLQGSIVSKITLLAILFLVLAYSVRGLRFKEQPVLDSMTSSAHFVGPMVYALTLSIFTYNAWPYILAFFLWGMASQAFGAVQDIIPDRKANFKSIATVLGARRTVYFAIMLYATATILVISQGGFSIIVGLLGVLYIVNIARYWNVTDKTSYIANRAWRRFVWMNLFTGFIVTVVLLIASIWF